MRPGLDDTCSSSSATGRRRPSVVVVISVVVIVLAAAIGVHVLTRSVPRPRARAALVSVDQSSPYGATSSRQPAPVPHTLAGRGQYANPVSALDFPDPDVVNVNGTYVAFATGNAATT